MKTRNILLSMLVVLLFGSSSVKALEVSDGWTEYESGNTLVEVDKLLEFEEKLALRVNELNKNNLDKVYRYRMVVDNDKDLDDYMELSNDMAFESAEEALEWANSNTLELEGWSFIKNIVTSFEFIKTLPLAKYETLEEANKVVDEFESTIDEGAGNVIVNEVRDEEDDTTEKVENTYKFDTFEDAEESATGLRENEHYYVVEVNVVKEDPEYVETITNTLNVGFKTIEEAEAYIDSLESQGYNVETNILEVNDYNTLDKVYETKTMAEEALEEFLEQYPETEVSNIEELRDEDDDTTEKVENTYKFDTFEDATKAAEELRENTHDYIVDITVVAGTPELVETKTLTLNMVFDSREKALAYITSLENDGYTVTANIEEVIEISTLNQKYETLTEAENALAEFRTQCQEITSSNIEEIRDTKEDTTTTTTGTTEYETRESAQEEADKLTTSGDDYEVVATVREESKTVTEGPTNVESQQFDTREAAQAYIDSLKAQGYDVSDLEIKLVSFEESIWGDKDDVIVDPGTGNNTSFTYTHFDVTLLTEFTKIDAEGNNTTVTGVVTVGNVKINNKNVAMEGPSVDMNTGLTEYTSKERFNLRVTNNSLVEITGTVAYYTDASKKTLSNALPFTINGYLTESQNVCGGVLGWTKGFDLEFESITIINNKVVVDSNVVSKYKVVGTITKTEEQPIYYVDTTTTTYGYDYNVKANGTKLTGYSVKGNALKNIYKDIYLLDINKTIKDYDYKVTANGIKFIEYLLTGTFSKDIYKDVYLLDINKTTKDYDYEVSGNGIKTLYDVISKYVRLVNTNYIIEFMELGKGGDVEVLPPQTGVNNINSYNIIYILLMGIILVIKKFI